MCGMRLCVAFDAVYFEWRNVQSWGVQMSHSNGPRWSNGQGKFRVCGICLVMYFKLRHTHVLCGVSQSICISRLFVCFAVETSWTFWLFSLERAHGFCNDKSRWKCSWLASVWCLELIWSQLLNYWCTLTNALLCFAPTRGTATYCTILGSSHLSSVLPWSPIQCLNLSKCSVNWKIASLICRVKFHPAEKFSRNCVSCHWVLLAATISVTEWNCLTVLDTGLLLCHAWCARQCWLTCIHSWSARAMNSGHMFTNDCHHRLLVRSLWSCFMNTLILTLWLSRNSLKWWHL